LVANDLRPKLFNLAGSVDDINCLRNCKSSADYPKEVSQRIQVNFTPLGERHYILNYSEYGIPFNPNNMTYFELRALHHQWQMKVCQDDSQDIARPPLTGLAHYESIRHGLRKPGTTLSWRHSAKAAFIYATGANC